MIHSFIFDMGNVIIKWDPQYIVEQYTRDSNEQELLLKTVFQSESWLAFDAGTISRDTLIGNVQAVLPANLHTIATDMIYHWYQYCPIIEEMSTLIEELDNMDYHIYLLSNTNLYFDEYRDTIPIFKKFDGFYISAVHKLTKPNPEIYLDFLETFSLSAKDCYFVDDLEANIRGANRVGIRGFCFSGDIEELRQDIKK